MRKTTAVLLALALAFLTMFAGAGFAEQEASVSTDLSADVSVLQTLAAFFKALTAGQSAEETGEKTDVQYVLYLGTNDKDTNTPVFTREEALEKLKAILIKDFGGYTIQEAHGGWIDDGKEYQEYTLVIYLSDTTLDQVHAAAAEMIETFNQSSVLIQENPTRTEYYSGE